MNTNDLSQFKQVMEEILVPFYKQYGIKLIVSGGYVRDTLLGRKPNDVDIYYDECYAQEVASFFRLENEENCWTFYKQTEKIQDDLYKNIDMMGVSRKQWNGFEINLMSMRHKHNGWDKYKINIRQALGISQCSLDIDGIEVSDLFEKDVQNKTMTLARTEWGLDQSMRYFMKLYPRFQYPLVLVDSLKGVAC